MRNRGALWAVLAALVAGTAVIVAVASVGGSSKPSRLPALALGSRAADERASAAMYPYPGAVEYRVEGTLPRLADHAHAWTLGRDGDRDRVAALAKTLGLAGAVTETPESWTVRDNDRQLLVNRLPGLPWQLYSGGPECIAPDAAVSSPPASAQDKAGAIGCAVSAGGTATAVEAPPPPTEVAPCPPCPTTPGTMCVQCVPAPQPEPTPTRPADMPSKDEAARVARDLLTRTGLDLTGADVQVQDGFSQWSVQVAPTVGGLPTMGWTWSVAVGPKSEIANANGWLGTPDEGDDYPLAGVDAGLKRLKENPYGPGPVPMAAARDQLMPQCAGSDCPPSEPVVRTITGVRLGLLFAPLAGDGSVDRTLLVPAYLFDIKDGGTVPVLAVADEFLPKPAPVEPAPKPEPAPAPRQSSAGCSGSAGGAAADEQNQPLSMEVCASPSRAAAGEEVVFTVDAKDPDGGVAAPHAAFGDGATEGPEPADAPPCAATTQTQTTHAGGLHQQFGHRYGKPGTYTATFAVGKTCDSGSSSGTVSIEVTVTQ